MKNRIEIIAEIAQGFEGSEELTNLLTKGAIASNADAVKFQLVYADELATPDYIHYKLFKDLEMDKRIWVNVCNQIKTAGKKVYFDVFGLFSLEMAKEIGADGIKISTTEFYNNDLFDRAITKFNRLYLSVGGIPAEEINQKLSALSVEQKNKICLMYGFQSEPTPLDQNNLNKLRIFKNSYPDFRIGFMDHADGALDDAFHLPLVAMGTGIQAIEKHITLDRELEIEDYISGLTPSMFIKFVSLIRRFECVMGIDSLELTKQEIAYRNKATKSIVALSNLKAGDVLTIENVALKRCAELITKDSILKIEHAIGKTLKVDIKTDSPVAKGDI